MVTPSQAHTSSQHAHEQNDVPLSSCWDEMVTQSRVWTQFDSEVTFSAMGMAQVSPARPMQDRKHTWLLQCRGAVGPPGQGRADVSPLSPGLGSREAARTGHKKCWLKSQGSHPWTSLTQQVDPSSWGFTLILHGGTKLGGAVWRNRLCNPFSAHVSQLQAML